MKTLFNIPETKNINNIIFIVLLLLFYGTANSQGLKLSHHDFSGASWSGNEYCKPCHTPHNANMEVPNSPLWNHEATTAIFLMYTSPTINGISGQPTGKTKLCLSCHDGTVAIENHSGNTNGTSFVNASNLTSNLTDDHPISFVYNTALATMDDELYDPSSALSGLGGTIEQDLLENKRMECTSCHDVHISRNTQGCTGCHQMDFSTGCLLQKLYHCGNLMMVALYV